MPVTGRKPKPEGQSRNRNKPTHDWTEVQDVPFEGGRDLPAQMPDGRPWPARTKRWWKVISAMPHCSLWTESDWEFAEDTASIAAVFHAGDVKVATELRNREKVLGTTVDYRRDLRIRYVDRVKVEQGVDGDVTSLDSYRDAIS